MNFSKKHIKQIQNMIYFNMLHEMLALIHAGLDSPDLKACFAIKQVYLKRCKDSVFISVVEGTWCRFIDILYYKYGLKYYINNDLHLLRCYNDSNS